MSATKAARDRESQLVTVFVRLIDTLIDDYDAAEVLHELTVYCVQLLDVDAAGLVLTNQSGELEVAAASVEQTRLLELFQILAREGPCQDCVRTGEPVLADDLREYPGRWPEFVPVALNQDFRSVHSVPMRLRQDTIGALNLFGRNPTSLDDQDLNVARALADVATIGIMQQRSIQRGEVLAEQLQHALTTRITIEQAKGLIAQSASVSVEEGFQHLRDYARSHGMRLSELARRIVDRTLQPADIFSTRLRARKR